MIHARIDVLILTHPRAYRAGPEAMGVWLFCVAYARQQETDGFVPESAVRGAWGGKHNLRLASKLVSVGLLALAEGGYSVSRYETKNETKIEIDARRRVDADRQANFRIASNPKKHVEKLGVSRCDMAVTNAVVTPPVTLVTNDGVTRTESESESESDQENPLPLTTSAVAVAASPPVTLGAAPAPVPSRGVSASAWADSGIGWCADYERIVQGELGTPWVFPQQHRSALRDILAGYCLGPDRNPVNLPGWLAKVLKPFVAEAKMDPEPWSSYSPKGLLRWLNAGKFKAQVVQPAPVRPRVKAVEAPPVWTEEHEQRNRDLLAYMEQVCREPVPPSGQDAPGSAPGTSDAPSLVPGSPCASGGNVVAKPRRRPYDVGLSITMLGGRVARGEMTPEQAMAYFVDGLQRNGLPIPEGVTFERAERAERESA